MTVRKGTLGCRLCHLSTHSGMCCISGCTLMITSGLYFMIPATTSLKIRQLHKIKFLLCIAAVELSGCWRLELQVLGVVVGEGGEVHAVHPARGGAMEGHLPEADVADHELVRPLHVVQRPAAVLFPQIPHEHLHSLTSTKIKSNFVRGREGLV